MIMALTKAHNRMIAGAPVNVKDFGAVGDGVADDTAAIQAAIDAQINRGIYIPEGVYKITSTLVIGTDGVTPTKSWQCNVQGAGRGTILHIATDGIVGVWFKRTSPAKASADPVLAYPGKTSQLRDLCLVGPQGMSGATFVGLDVAPTDTTTLLKCGGHTTDGDAFNFDSAVEVSNVGFWCANVGWKNYLNHYTDSFNLVFEQNNRDIVSLGAIGSSITTVSFQETKVQSVYLKACDAFTFSNPVFQYQNYTANPVLQIEGSARGVVVHSPYFEAFDATTTLIDVAEGGAGAGGAEVNIQGGCIIGSTGSENITVRGATLNVNGLYDANGNVTINGSGLGGQDSRVDFDEDRTLLSYSPSNTAQDYKITGAQGVTKTQTGVEQKSNFSGTFTTQIPTSRRGGGVFNIVRRISSSAAQHESVSVYIGETGTIEYTTSVISGLSFTDDGGYLKISATAAPAMFEVNWAYF